MFRKLFLIIAPILFFAAISIQMYCLSQLIGRSPLLYISIVFFAASILWILIMGGLYGSLLKVKWALVLEAAFLMFMMLAVVMKLQHWPYWRLIGMVGSILSGLVYLIHFIMKKKKKIIDISKLLFVLSTLSFYLVTIFNRVDAEFIAGLWFLALLLLFITVWIYVFRFKETVEQPVIAQEGDAIFNYMNRNSNESNA